MKNYFKIIALIVVTLTSLNSFAQEKWGFVKDDEYCYIQSIPIKTEIPEGKSRGEHGILVYKMHHNPEMIIQITAGFSFQSKDAISVKIDDGDYSFYADDDTAWAKEDSKTIYAMKKGLTLVAEGISSKGTKVIDTYSLKGFTASINKLSNDC